MSKNGNYNQTNEIDWLHIGVKNQEMKAIFFTKTTLDNGDSIEKRLPIVEVNQETFQKFYNLSLDKLPKGMLLGDIIQVFLLYSAYKKDIGFEKPTITKKFELILKELFEIQIIEEIEEIETEIQ